MSVFAPLTWFGRVLLWIVFLPIGLWRSVRHGRRKETDRLVRQINSQQAAMQQNSPMRIRGIPSEELPPPP